MKIKNISTKLQNIPKLKYNYLGNLEDVSMEPNAELEIFDEVAERSTALAAKIDAGEISILSSDEPGDASSSADTDVAATSHTHSNKAELDLIAGGDKANWDGEIGAKADAATAQGAIDTHQNLIAGNPHAVTKSEVGLGNVVDTLQAAKGVAATSPDGVAAAGANPTKAEYDAVVLLVNELKGILNTMNA